MGGKRRETGSMIGWEVTGRVALEKKKDVEGRKVYALGSRRE